MGELLRWWREQRRLSQLALSIQAEISTRHLSFVETGRAAPSREMVLRLAEQLAVPLRQRNSLLLAVGYAPSYGETGLESPEMAAVRAAVRQVLTGHEPFPALAMDRHWNLVDANTSLGRMIGDAAPELLTPPVNVLRLSLHPDGIAPRIVNLGEWRAHLLARLRRQAALTADPDLAGLYAELRGYPCAEPHPEIDTPGPGAVVVPLRLRSEGMELAFFGIAASFGIPTDITVEELAIELFFPSDEATRAALQAAYPAPA